MVDRAAQLNEAPPRVWYVAAYYDKTIYHVSRNYDNADDAWLALQELENGLIQRKFSCVEVWPRPLMRKKFQRIPFSGNRNTIDVFVCETSDAPKSEMKE